jgi:hypothetical protein
MRQALLQRSVRHPHRNFRRAEAPSSIVSPRAGLKAALAWRDARFRAPPAELPPDGIERGTVAPPGRRRHHRWWPQRARMRGYLARRSQTLVLERRLLGGAAVTEVFPASGCRSPLRDEPAVAAGDRRPRARSLRSHGLPANDLFSPLEDGNHIFLHDDVGRRRPSSPASRTRTRRPIRSSMHT